MSIDEAIKAFRTAGPDLPLDAMLWTRDNWEEAAPRLLSLLEAFADGSDNNDEAMTAAAFAAHLCAQMGETRAFPALLRLMHNQEELECVLGFIGSTENLPGILIKCFDGDTAGLRALVEDAAADGATRGTALMFMAWLTHQGRLSHEEMRAWLLQLLATMQPSSENWVWADWAVAVAALAYTDLLLLVERLFRDEFIPVEWLDMQEFQSLLRRNLDDPEREAVFKEEGFTPFADAVPVMTEWLGSGHDGSDVDDGIDLPEGFTPSVEPRVNPFRNVGRNDPCPCGSGKKYKKCCLVAA